MNDPQESQSDRTLQIGIALASLTLYVLSLALPGFYLGETRRPVWGVYLLMNGWLGILAGYLAWYANPFYWWTLAKALFFAKHHYYAALFALVLALSFLRQDRVMQSMAPTYEDITGYGWGYALWILSIGILAMGQMFLSWRWKPRVTIVLLISVTVGAVGFFSHYYFVGHDSLFEIQQQRHRLFAEKCEQIGRPVLGTAEHVESVFIDPNWAVDYRRWNTGDWHVDGGGIVLYHEVENGTLDFYETRADGIGPGEKRYVRYVLSEDGQKEVRIPVDRLESQYAVVTRGYDLPPQYAIRGAEIRITNRETGKLLARTAYVFNAIEKEFCGYAPGGRFSSRRFIRDTLRLDETPSRPASGSGPSTRGQ